MSYDSAQFLGSKVGQKGWPRIHLEDINTAIAMQEFGAPATYMPGITVGESWRWLFAWIISGSHCSTQNIVMHYVSANQFYKWYGNVQQGVDLCTWNNVNVLFFLNWVPRKRSNHEQKEILWILDRCGCITTNKLGLSTGQTENWTCPRAVLLSECSHNLPRTHTHLLFEPPPIPSPSGKPKERNHLCLGPNSVQMGKEH